MSFLTDACQDSTDECEAEADETSVLFTLKEFENACRYNVCTDDDGVAQYVDWEGELRERVSCADAAVGKLEHNKYVSVRWFGK